VAGAPSPDASATPTSPLVEAPIVERTRESLTVEEVNAAVLPPELPAWKGANPLVLKAQVMLDRAGASPGVIDAYSGGNFSKAISAVESVLGLPVDGVLDTDVWDALGGDAAPAVFVRYAITAEDLSYPFAPVPAELVEQARLPALGYASLEEMLSERFHMDPKLLAALNPGANFQSAGTEIWVAAVDAQPITDQVARIVADKGLKQLRAYDAASHLIAAYPATIGSEQNPSPIGEHIVAAVVRDPVYEYESPSFFGDVGQRIALAPGPNNPMGTALIDLGEPGYAIHGAAEPSQVGKGATLGCVRLTNWDAEELAGIIQPGIVVSFQ
jgi:lipoprotein-anchoring transpeptidase ErfK/SrfK